HRNNSTYVACIVVGFPAYGLSFAAGPRHARFRSGASNQRTDMREMIVTPAAMQSLIRGGRRSSGDHWRRLGGAFIIDGSLEARAQAKERPLIPRYTRPEMGRIWSDENKFRCWLQVETAASLTLAEAGMVPQEAAQAIAQRGGFNLKRIHEIEAEVKHDVIAFTTAVAEKAGPEARGLHSGLTSNAVVDTAQALQIKDASRIILDGLNRLKDVLARRAREFQNTPMVGRTHGIHAEPTTFGLKLANWYGETVRNIARFERSAAQRRVGRPSGAVGTFAHLEPELEERICRRLGLEPAPISSQVIQRDRHAYYVATLATIASTLDKIATEVRHLQRTELREAEEYFS